MKSKRIQWLDFAKGFTILCVVLFHVLVFRHNIITYILGTFIMPVFFAVSGYLYVSTDSWHKYIVMWYKKIVGFLIPYCSFVILVDILWGKLLKYHLNTFNSLLFTPIYYLWFLVILFLVFIFVSSLFVCRIPLFIQLICTIIIISMTFTCSFLKYNNDVHLFEGYLICFYIGYLIKRFYVIKYLRNVYCGSLLLIFWIIYMLISYNFIGIKDVDNFHYYDIFIKITSIFVFFSLFLQFNKKNKVFKYFTKCGRYTLIIYLVHLPIIMVFNFIIKRLINSYLINSVLLLMISWFLSILICHIALKIKLLNFIFYPRKYIDNVFYK